jgi:ATP-dependent RNA helicase MSS116
MSQRRGRESDLDDDNDDDDVVGFGDSGAREVKKFDFGLSEDDDEVGEVDEDDDPSGLEDDLIDDEGSKESGSFKLDKEEAVKHKSIAGTSTRGGDSYLSQKR